MRGLRESLLVDFVGMGEIEVSEYGWGFEFQAFGEGRRA